MEGIFCSNFCEPRGSWPACQMVWHAKCYECLGQGKFPMKQIEDEEGNLWYKQGQREERINHGVIGSNASIPFQCERCWMINLEARLPVDGLDDLYVACIRRANLDASGGLAVSTIKAKASSIKRTVGECKLLRKTPLIPSRGPMPMEDNVGMGMAVEMLFHSLVAKPRLKDQKFIQFDSMRKLRSVFTSAWESSPRGISEGSTFTTGTARVTVTFCPTQQRWFSLFMRPEVFLLDLAGLWEHVEMGRLGSIPDNPLKVGVNLANAPHVVITLLGEFKGESGTHRHRVALASTTQSGIEVRWWLEQLLDVRRLEGCRTGPAFGDRLGRVALMSEYDGLLIPLLERIQITDPDLIAPSDDVQMNYSFFRSFRRTATGRARAAGLGDSVQNAMNRWRMVEQAKGRRPRFNMVDHYTHVRDLMPVTWRYSYVQ